METSSQMTGTGPALPLFISKKLPQPNQKKKKKKNLYLMLCFRFHQLHSTQSSTEY